MSKPLTCHTPGKDSSDSACKRTQKNVTSSAAPDQMKHYTKCRTSGILKHFIIKDVKLQSPLSQKHPSANTTILFIYKESVTTTLIYSFHCCSIYKCADWSTFNISLITMKKKPRGQKPYKVTLLAIIGAAPAPNNPEFLWAQL